MSPVYRGTHTVGVTRREPERQGGLQLHFRVPRHAARAEFPARQAPPGRDRAAASHAALTTACTAGGLHGG